MQEPSNESVDRTAQDGAGETIEHPTRKTLRPLHEEPDQIGPYRILQKMGEGGMGVVYKAEQREPVRRVVALKIIKLGMDTREVVARFEAERQALALMAHPNVAKVFDAGSTDHGRPYFAMEFVPGIPLTDYCDQNKLTTRQRLELFIPVCHAVQHAHQKGIIHRDLKPSNILVSMFDGNPIPKVIDFGIAKAANQALTQKTLYTQTGSLIGTPEYMSPEQAQTSGLDVDTRTDVYSLGVIIYELLTGQLPFDADSLRKAGLEGMARIIRETEPSKPSTRVSLVQTSGTASHQTPSEITAHRHGSDSRALQRELRGDLDWITLKAMEKDRTRRYETASAFAGDIRRYLDNDPITARPPSTAYRLSKTVHKHKLGVAAASLVLVALLLGVIGTSIEMVRARAAERDAVQQRKIAEVQRASAMENEAKADQNMARIYQVKGDFASADPLLRHAIDIYRQLRGPLHPDVAAALGELGLLQKSKGDFSAAEKTFNDVLAMSKDLTGENSPQAAQALEKLGSLYIASGQPERAEPILRQSFDIYRTNALNDPMGFASTTGDLGMLLYRKGDATAAEPLLDQSLVLWRGVPHFESYVAYDIAAIAQTLWKIHEARGDKHGAHSYIRAYYLIQIAHISMGIAASPHDTSFLHGRSEMYRVVAEFSKMADDLETLIQVTPDDMLLYMQAATARLYLRENTAYEILCGKMLQRFGNSSDARTRDRMAKTFLAGKQSTRDFPRILEMARANLDPALLQAHPDLGGVIPLFRLCGAMAEYRGQHFQRVLDLLDNTTLAKLDTDSHATAFLLLAMAAHQLGNETNAQAYLATARDFFTRTSDPADDIIEPSATIQDWLVAQTIRREADVLFASK